MVIGVAELGQESIRWVLLVLDEEGITRAAGSVRVS